MGHIKSSAKALRQFVMTFVCIASVLQSSTAAAEGALGCAEAETETAPRTVGGIGAFAKGFLHLTGQDRQAARTETPARQQAPAVAQNAPAPAPARTPSATEGCRRNGTGGGSFYGNQFDGRRTASGAIFRQTGMTVAHRTLPFGTVVVIRDPSTGRTVRATVTDRGPFAAGRIVDMSRAVFQRLASTDRGVLRNLELWTCTG